MKVSESRVTFCRDTPVLVWKVERIYIQAVCVHRSAPPRLTARSFLLTLTAINNLPSLITLPGKNRSIDDSPTVVCLKSRHSFLQAGHVTHTLCLVLPYRDPGRKETKWKEFNRQGPRCHVSVPR